MPSPVGHALGGIALGWRAVPRAQWRAALTLAAVAVAPDLDLLVGDHRGISHSVGAAVIVGVVAAILWSAFAPPALRRDTLRVALCATLAWTSHVALDWLSNDTRAPIGVMALWPFSDGFYQSSLFLFDAISRRYWLPQEFIWHNLRAALRELVILAPLAHVAWRLGRVRG